MAFENLLIRKKRKIGGIAIDGVIEETTNRSVRITEHPVEDATTISDHVIRVPLAYIMEGVITDTPLATEAITGIVDSVSGVFGKSEESGQTRSQQIFSELVKLLDAREIIEIQATLQLYKDLVFESISVKQDKDTSRSIHFTATFKQVLIVKSASTEVDARNISNEKDKAGQGAIVVKGEAPVSQASDAVNLSITSSLGK